MSPMKKATTILMLILATVASAQNTPIMETGGQQMPNEWIDKDTGHRIIKLTRRPGRNSSFYFTEHQATHRRTVQRRLGDCLHEDA